MADCCYLAVPPAVWAAVQHIAVAVPHIVVWAVELAVVLLVAAFLP